MAGIPVFLSALIFIVIIRETFGGQCTENYPCVKTCYYRTSRRSWWRTRYGQAAYKCTKTCSRNVCCKGYTGSTCTTDINECTKKTDNCAQTCTNTIGSYKCSCNTGYKLSTDGRSCLPLCFGSTSCPNGGRCVSPDKCSCLLGYTAPKCDDIDECKVGSHLCAHDCSNTKGSYRCSCRPGFTLHTDGRSCKGKYCKQQFSCAQTCYRRLQKKSGWWIFARITYSTQAYQCTKTCTRNVCCPGYTGTLCAKPLCAGSINCPNGGTCYTPNNCKCKPGFGGERCADINECKTTSHGCKHSCTNTNGSYRCSCHPGYTLADDGRACKDMNECTAPTTHKCTQDCTNTLGSYTCACRAGYTLGQDGFSCFDMNECAGDHGCAGTCHNTKGSYTCTCDDTGYALAVDQRSCEDIDECTLNAHECVSGCRNTIGSYVCTCNPGFRLATNGKNCVDVDECMTAHMCQHTCVNTDGSYTCTCMDGYAKNGYHCRDIDECEDGLHNCEQICLNKPGSHGCACSDGFELSDDGTSCIDIDECAGDAHVCSQICVNKPGSYGCSCDDGYRLTDDNRLCHDIDECTENTAGCSHGCTNIEGSYQCSCPLGYQLGDDVKTCSDTDECTENRSGCSYGCTNTEGSFVCFCMDGYLLGDDGKTCFDIDECAGDAHDCSQICVNKPGSYGCSCDDGYRLTDDNRSCRDVDECFDMTSGCSDTCNNTVGSFECSCEDGYQLGDDDKTCSDIDECIEDTHDCEHTCNNTLGSYTCVCNGTYTLADDGRTCNDPEDEGPMETCIGVCNMNNWGYEVVLPGTNCTKYCDCAPLNTHPNGTVEFFWQEMPCGPDTKWHANTRTCSHDDETFVCNETIIPGNSSTGNGGNWNGSWSGNATNGSGINNCPAECALEEWGEYAPLPDYSCTMYCHCIPATTNEDGSISFYSQQMPCSPGTLWNDTENTCDHAYNVNCTDSGSSDGSPDGDSGQCEALCSQDRWGYMVVMPGTGCKQYCHCAPLNTNTDGSKDYYWQSMRCGQGSLWDVHEYQCKPDYLVTCNDEGTGNPGDSNTDDTCSATCNEGNWGSSVALGRSGCSSFCVCHTTIQLGDGSEVFHAAEMPCAPGTLWDARINICNHEDVVECNSEENEAD